MTEISFSGLEASGEQYTDPLFLKIEAAIKVASELGADCFDYIEGRGLAQMRAEIAAEIFKLRSVASPLSESSTHE